MKLALDTNAYVALRRGDERVARRVRSAHGIVISVVVIGELLLGFRLGSRAAANRALLESFLAEPRVEVVPIGHSTAERFALVAASLRAKGRPIPTNDLWIAAQMLECGAELLSFDRDFAQVEGLLWADPSC
ncbi:MAG: hypothetical protein A2138_04645 [Deltaproteobacteria bacterium RBG_16_71_12]|nr:MAG: hypothetical protein A2138_04645 [Deltaproteobacteria bacterium RBG_16_71_12]